MLSPVRSRPLTQTPPALGPIAGQAPQAAAQARPHPWRPARRVHPAAEQRSPTACSVSAGCVRWHTRWSLASRGSGRPFCFDRSGSRMGRLGHSRFKSTRRSTLIGRSPLALRVGQAGPTSTSIYWTTSKITAREAYALTICGRCSRSDYVHVCVLPAAGGACVGASRVQQFRYTVRE